MTSIRTAMTARRRGVAESPSSAVLRSAVAPALIVTTIAVSLLLLMTPPWMHLALDASGGSRALPTVVESRALSDRTVTELFTGPGTFAAFTAGEAAHMRDVRLVLLSFLSVAAVLAAALAVALRAGWRDPRTWRSLSRGGAALAVGTVAIGALGALAFGVAFEVFHRILFPGGNWAFPESSLLIRLYPLGFWQLSTAALGALMIVGGVTAWIVGRRRARSLRESAAA